MKVVDISDLRSHTGEEVTVRGWLRRKRSSGKIQFLFLRDGSGFVQAIVERSSVSDSVFQNANNLKMESSVVVNGVVKVEERAPGGVELLVTDIEVVQIPEKDFPINKPDHSIDFLMDNRHLWLRTQRQTHILKIRHEIIKAVREFYNDRDFILVDTPIFTGSIGESAGNTFEIDYFDYGKAYLAQTGQLYLEAAAMALGKVYNLGPTFRAEKSKTRRHLIEFWMNEAEVAYYRHEDNIKLQEDLVSYVVHRTLERAGDLLAIGRDIGKLKKMKPPSRE
jgi:asparaginyl-tRNA synthetase